MTGTVRDRLPASDGESGTTLVEVLVVLAIVGVLAATAIPFSQTAVQRHREIALQETLRTTRSAIDAFHEDWLAGRFEDGQEGVSENGYPEDLEVLVTGLKVQFSEDKTSNRRYLRRLPNNPFASAGESQWTLLGYTQPPTAATWDRVDVYDLRAISDRKALNGTAIADW